MARNTFVLMIVLIAMIAGAATGCRCSERSDGLFDADSMRGSAQGYSTGGEPADQDICRSSLEPDESVPVAGRLTADARTGAVVRVFSVADLSLNASLAAAQSGRPIGNVTIADGRRFALGRLKAGCYVAMVPRDAFGKAQGFPVIDEINDSKVTVDMAFHGGDNCYSLAAFVVLIRPGAPRDNESGDAGDDP